MIFQLESSLEMNDVRLELTPKTVRFLIRACELASGLKHDDPNDEWLYDGLAKELQEKYEVEQERLEARIDLKREALDAATDSLDRAGRAYLWWPNALPWRELDPIGKDEFQAIAADIVRTYLQKAKPPFDVERDWRCGIKTALFAAAALRDWLSDKLIEWQDLDELPDGWDWNDVPLFEGAIKELSRLGHYAGETM